MTHFHQTLEVDRLLEPGKENLNIHTDIHIVRALKQFNKLSGIFFHSSIASKVNSPQRKFFQKNIKKLAILTKPLKGGV